ncbi:Hypothetical_protein [Hexamita inflata]|uniref:Hypothetical_protein n=1 Tax=Hexamita inflata TaxID=28002 RepID=A0AA86Q2U2_9EUKA|nr:Hypothetical protein HINF_LOCUS32004 [Hexamita inflata]CAI9973017.1 Hypothetical protein HINF_LOCUS60662 [Hexamita inflata]
MSFQYGGQVDGFKQASGINHWWTIEQYLNEAQGDISNAISIFLRKIAEFREATSSNEVQAKILLNKDYDVAIAVKKYRESVAGFKQASGISHTWTIEQYLNETEYNVSNAMQILQRKISEFCETTSSNEQEARKFLKFDYDVAIAAEKYFVEQDKQQQQNQQQNDENEETLIAKFMGCTECSKDVAKQYLYSACNDINIALNKQKIDKQNRDKQNVPNQTQDEHDKQNVNQTQQFDIQPQSEQIKSKTTGFFGQKKEKKEPTFDQKYIYQPNTNENNVSSEKNQEQSTNVNQNGQDDKIVENQPNNTFKQDTSYAQQPQNCVQPNNFVQQQSQASIPNVPVYNIQQQSFQANPAQQSSNFGQQQNQNNLLQGQQSFQPNSPYQQAYVQQSNNPVHFGTNYQAPIFVPNQFNQQNQQFSQQTQQFQPVNSPVNQQFVQQQVKQFQPNNFDGTNRQIFSPNFQVLPNNQFNQQVNQVKGTVVCVVYDGNKALIFLQQQLKMFQEQFLVNHQIETLNDSDILTLTVQEQYFEQVKKALIDLHTQESLLHQQRKNEVEIIKQKTEKELNQLKQDNDNLKDQIQLLKSEKEKQYLEIKEVQQVNQKFKQQHNDALMNLSQQTQQNYVLLQEVQKLRDQVNQMQKQIQVNPQIMQQQPLQSVNSIQAQVMSPRPQIVSPQPQNQITAAIEMQTQPQQIQNVGQYLVNLGANVQQNGSILVIQYTPIQAQAIEQALNDIVGQLRVKRLQ